MSYTNSELKAMSDEQVVHAELQLDRDLVSLRFRKNADQLRDVNQIKTVRRNIARIRTEQRRREIEAGLSKDALREIHRATFAATATASVEGSSFGADLNEQMEDGE
jgi:large subunit ribosomal protein L29